MHLGRFLFAPDYELPTELSRLTVENDKLEKLRNAGEALAFTVERVLRRDTLAGQRRTLRESLDRWAEALDEEEE